MNLMIFDGNSILNRGFYGVRPLNAPDGTPTNAVFGFLTIFNRIVSEIGPDAVCVAFDVHAPTFRHKACEAYKATRRPMPDELRVQLPLIREVLSQMGLRIYELEGYEADDVIGTVARICEEQGSGCTVVTGDKDSLQLVSDLTSVCLIKTAKGETTTSLYTPEVFRTEYGFDPPGMVDLKSLMGDSSDNIPGVPGIGEKTAMELIRTYGSLKEVYEHIDDPNIKESVRKKLREGEESACSSFWLATIFREVPLEFSPADNLWNNNFQPGLYSLFRRLGFNRMIEKFALKSEAVSGGSDNETSSEQPAEEKYPALPKIPIDEGNLDSVLSAVKAAERIGVSLEQQSGLDFIELCDGKNIYTADRLSGFLIYDRIMETVFSPDVKKVSSDVKQTIRLLLEAGLPADGFVFDCALAAYLITGGEPDRSASGMSAAFLKKELDGSYAWLSLCEPMNERLKELGQDQLYYSAELPLCRVLAEMEVKGFLIDRQALYEFGENLTGQIDALHRSIVEYAGHEFNINSPKQLGEVLFDELQLPNGKKTKTGWSTSADVLETIAVFHPIVDEILEYRMLTKLKSTYADGLLKVIAPDGRIHTSFQMTVTATGRLSSTEPNLQNIPIRKSLGAQIRSMFIAPEGSVLIDADYSQIELRVLAHISKDVRMAEAFASGKDFHSVTASNVFHIPLEDVTPEIRSRAKAVNFGIVYGMQAFTLAKDTGVTVREAKAYMDAYFAEYAGVDAYLKSIVEKADREGYVSTLYGRRRNIPELKSSNRTMREFGKRVALNMPVQGTAADIMKLAMVSVHARLKKAGLRASLVLQVHDELIVECPEEEKDTVISILKESMENAVRLNVRLPVEVGAAKNWSEAH
ncbi:MAG: DNA polymerase I [Eubacteriales bacterium]|nr:DNA polymerase I [Eubacteriales bacterium]